MLGVRDTKCQYKSRDVKRTTQFWQMPSRKLIQHEDNEDIKSQESSQEDITRARDRLCVQKAYIQLWPSIGRNERTMLKLTPIKTRVDRNEFICKIVESQSKRAGQYSVARVHWRPLVKQYRAVIRTDRTLDTPKSRVAKSITPQISEREEISRIYTWICFIQKREYHFAS